MDSVGDAHDNAPCEASLAALGCGLLDQRRRLRARAGAGTAALALIEGRYTPGRRHSALGYISPVEYEGRTRTSA
ncbi:MAG TPA: hypothetical protein VFG47_16305 [Geminicoccaceae bacterium]|nr:hypothetical protein [Geminicoccaceae bacterium]